MAYELGVCTSSLGVFSSIWGFHRVCMLECGSKPPNVLYVSENLASATASSEAHRVDMASNQAIVREFYFLVVTAILLTFGDRVIPPSLRNNEAFLSYFRGSNEVRLLSFFMFILAYYLKELMTTYGGYSM